MKSSAILLLLIIAAFVAPKALAEDADWETHYVKAEKAYASCNLFEARREFMVALKGAQDCKQASELATRVESLATTYQARDNNALAQPLFKLARKLKSKCTST
ncbi:MAG: hypothetical protein K2X77_16415 [Candidatus Obscuribacterales bacterium]|jgi:uncharacterized protein (DUF3084 family)|nr:hypothetical protein [Candidatus Obscuribacterales bacterium]